MIAPITSDAEHHVPSRASSSAAPIRRPLRVLHVITALELGGAERELEFLLPTTRHEASALCLYSCGTVGERIRANGSTVHLLGMQGRDKLTALWRLTGYIRKLSPDVVHVHLLSGQLFGIPAARLAGVRVVVSTEHSLMDRSIEGRARSRSLRTVYRMLERLTTRTVAVSERTRQRLTVWGVPDRVRPVIENAVDFGAHAFDPAARRALRTEWACSEDTVVLGAVGRLVGVKRFGPLLHAVAPILRESDVRLVIVGEGSEAGPLKDTASDLGISDRVHFAGGRTDVARVLNGFDVFVSPSRSETFGMAIVESVANGLPTVFEQCPALEDLATTPPWISCVDASGRDDILSLREAVRSQLESGPQRRVVPGELRRRYDIRRTAAAYDRLYEELVVEGESDRRRHIPPGRFLATLGRRGWHRQP